jgi:hypothetical protein
MREGKNMGSMVTFKKPSPEREIMGLAYQQYLDNLRRKGLLPRLKNDRSIC